ncbi:MAG: hypothetical protein ABSG26_16010 [Bryobacteraceae bacterium]|jgi:hypothetical protein
MVLIVALSSIWKGLALAGVLLAAPTGVELVDEVYQIPAGQWRYIEVSLKQQPALVSATFQVLTGSPPARIALMRRQDLERLRDGQPHGVMAVTPLASHGNLSYYVHWPDDYAIVVDNRAAQPSAVHLRISLEFGSGPGPAVTRLSARRQLAVILISFAVFFGIVSFSARCLWRVVKGPPVNGD